jgi:hypothetical protein
MFRMVACVIFLGAVSGQTMVDLRTQSKSVDFSSAATTKPFKSGASLPTTCSVGEMYYLTNAAAGANLFGCTSPNAWTLESQGGASLPGVSGNAGKVLSTDGTNLLWNSLGGDLSGAPASATVIQLQGRPVTSTAPQSGQTLTWNAGSGMWTPQTPASGSGGPFSLSQAQDLAVTRTSSTVLTIGASCSTALPCNVRFGTIVFSIVASATVTVSSGSGLAYGYLTSAGALTIGGGLTVGCSSNCNVQPGAAAFPDDTVPLFTWSATSGTWDTSGMIDYRAFLSNRPITPGTGLIGADSGGTLTLSADASLLGLRTAAPGTSSTACVTGSWAMDSSFFYVCAATNSWRRTATSSW